jgi:hypothetical protein
MLLKGMPGRHLRTSSKNLLGNHKDEDYKNIVSVCSVRNSLYRVSHERLPMKISLNAAETTISNGFYLPKFINSYMYLNQRLLVLIVCHVSFHILYSVIYERGISELLFAATHFTHCNNILISNFENNYN